MKAMIATYEIQGQEVTFRRSVKNNWVQIDINLGIVEELSLNADGETIIACARRLYKALHGVAGTNGDTLDLFTAITQFTN